MICHKCKTEIAEHFKYCPECGAAQIIDKDIIEFKYAGFWRRFAALIIDDVVLILMILIFGFGFFISTDLILYEDFTMEFFSSIIAILISWLYYAGMESSRWRATIGKIAIGIVVTDLDIKRISFGKATGRFFAKFISGLLLGIGYLMAAFTDRKQALHDIIAKCLVIDKENDYKILESSKLEQEKAIKKKKWPLIVIESLAIFLIYSGGTVFIILFANYIWDETIVWWVENYWFFENYFAIGLVIVTIILSLTGIIFTLFQRWKFKYRIIFTLPILIIITGFNYIAINGYNQIVFRSTDFYVIAKHKMRAWHGYYGRDSKSKLRHIEFKESLGEYIDDLLENTLTGNEEIVNYQCTTLSDSLIFIVWKSISDVENRNYAIHGIYDINNNKFFLVTYDDLTRFSDVLEKK